MSAGAEAIRAGLRCGNPRCLCRQLRGPVHCPSHPDEHPSLSVDERDGRTLVHCFAGCLQDEVVEALRARGLWSGRPPAPVLSRFRRGKLEGPLNEVARFVERYVRMPSNHATVTVALWTAYAWVFEAFDITPYLVLKSPVKRSAKSLLLKILALLLPRPWLVFSPSEAVLFRKISRDRPQVLLDESDPLFNGRIEQHEPLRALLNAGFERGATVPRCVGEGSKMQLVDFEVYCPKALAVIGNLPDTVEDRGIIISMKRATPAEQRSLGRFRRREAREAAAPIRDALARWAEVARPKLAEARPALPEELDARAADLWEPLLAVAEEAGDGWAVAAWEAALALSTGAAREDDSVRVRLLADIRRVFEERGTDRLATADLIEGLCEDEAAPWADWHGRRITPQALARLLRPFGIGPSQWRDGDRTGIRGYARDAFADSWARYIPGPSPPSTASKPLQPLQSGQGAGFSDFEEPLQPPFVAIAENGANPHRACVVADVAVRTSSEEEGAGDDEPATPEDPAALFPRDDGRPAATALPPWYRPDLGYPLPPDDGRRQATFRAGQALGWPAVTYRPGHSVASGEDAWRAFLTTNSDTEVAALWSALERLTGGAA